MAEHALQVGTQTIRADDGGCFALTRVIAEGVAVRAPVVMVPGMFTGRRFWLSDRHIGLAAWLARRGYPGFIVQRRGLSDSPACAARQGLVEHVTFDLPATQRRVTADFSQPAFWIGHSFGGVMSALACARHLKHDQIAGLVLFASQLEIGKRMLDWPGNLLTRALARLVGHFPARAAALGPEDEPLEALLDATDWVTRGRRDGELGLTLAAIDVPVLAISGTADRVDPNRGCARFIGHVKSTDRRFVRAGRDNGFSVDFDHPGIVVSNAAQAEIWPLLRQWLDARCSQAAVLATGTLSAS